MRGNSSANQRSENSRNSVEHDQKLIRLAEVPIEYARQIWAQSDQRFVCQVSQLLNQTEAR